MTDYRKLLLETLFRANCLMLWTEKPEFMPPLSQFDIPIPFFEGFWRGLLPTDVHRAEFLVCLESHGEYGKKVLRSLNLKPRRKRSLRALLALHPAIQSFLKEHVIPESIVSKLLGLPAQIPLMTSLEYVVKHGPSRCMITRWVKGILDNPTVDPESQLIDLLQKRQPVAARKRKNSSNAYLTVSPKVTAGKSR